MCGPLFHPFGGHVRPQSHAAVWHISQIQSVELRRHSLRLAAIAPHGRAATSPAAAPPSVLSKPPFEDPQTIIPHHRRQYKFTPEDNTKVLSWAYLEHIAEDKCQGKAGWAKTALTRHATGGRQQLTPTVGRPALRESDGLSFAPGAHARPAKARRWHYPQQKGANISNTKLEV